MAETMTYDAGTDTITTSENLTPEEQDSLQVGEAMIEEQNTLLAGKYENAKELEKAYVELSKKLGEKGDETSGETGESESTDTEATEEETEETPQDSPVTSLINEASAEFYENNNTLSPETIEKFSEMSSKDLVEAYIATQKNAKATTAEPEPIDLTESQVNKIKNSVGGEAEYDKIVGWASQNMPKSDVAAFDELVSSGNETAIKLAVAGMKANYENDNGYEGRMLTGKAPKTSGDVFRSQAEVVQAMSNPQYDNDPAYRMDVMEKLERSNINF
jgi:hypothetical protein